MVPPHTSLAAAIGPYTLIRQLGQGGMGVVWLVYDAMLARHVAIKELRAPIPAQSTLLKRLLREARAAARLSHPNVVTIYQVATESGPNGPRTYVVMEYVDGGSMAEYLTHHGPLPWRQAALMLRQAACGLAAAHEAGLIHRDIKPANLMRSQKGIIKLVDFGLARAQWADPELTSPGTFLGSPSFAAPEQAQLTHPIDERADIYSLACTFYALLTGQPPFTDDDASTVIQRHQSDPFPDPRTIAKESKIPDAICRLLLKASAKDPAGRYPSAEAFLAALESTMASPEQSHTFESAWPRQSIKSVATQELHPEVTQWRAAFRAHTQAGQLREAQDACRRGLAAYAKKHPPKNAGRS